MPSVSAILTAAAVSLAAVSSAKTCPPLGPVFPAPKAPSRSEAVQKASKALIAGIDEQLESVNASAISILVKSVHEDKPFFKYAFSPKVESGYGAKKIDENSIFRVGSISKTIPVILALQSKDVDLDASILEYLPELRNATSSDPLYATPWEDITVRSLASHLSGLATDTAQDLGLYLGDKATEMGLPKIPKGEGPTCSGIEGTEPCTKADLIRDLGKRGPVYEPEITPVYSNLGYALLGLVVEAATGKEFSDLTKDKIWDVAEMESTSFNGYIDALEKRVYVPPGDPTWNRTLGVYESAGGMFSSAKDLIALAEAIHENKLLSPAKTRAWMKPSTLTSSLGLSVGEVWEILRTDNVTADGRIVDVYTKSGGFGLYQAMFGIVPDYDVTFALTTGGLEVSSMPTAELLTSAIAKVLIPALEAAGREEASRFEGSYAEESSNSSLIISSDKGPGLLIKKFQVKGFDVLNGFESYNPAATIPDKLPKVDGRLLPTTRSRKYHNGSVETIWRAILDSTTDEDNEAFQEQLVIPDGTCRTWFQVDRASYNFKSLAEFSIVENSKGKIVEVKNRAFDVVLSKVDGKT